MSALTFDPSTDEYVTPEGQRISRAEVYDSLKDPSATLDRSTPLSLSESLARQVQKARRGVQADQRTTGYGAENHGPEQSEPDEPSLRERVEALEVDNKALREAVRFLQERVVALTRAVGVRR